jgi:hypothetical protein
LLHFIANLPPPKRLAKVRRTPQKHDRNSQKYYAARILLSNFGGTRRIAAAGGSRH